jgi:hypothetical protein
MPYLGNAPSATFQSVAYQDLTGGTGTSFTLSHAVSSAQELEVFVNNVRQEPTVAYSAVGTTLTMTGTIAATDDFYVVFQGKAVGSVSHPTTSPLAATTGTFSGNVTSSGTVTASSFSGDGSALTGLGGSIAFLATITTTYTVNASSFATIDYNTNGTEEFDVGNCFDKTNNKFIAPVAGIYQFNISLRVDSGTTNDYINMGLRTPSYSGDGQGTNQSDIVYRSAYVLIGQPSPDFQSLTASTILQCTANQEIEHWVLTETDTSVGINNRGSMFSGCFLG